MSEHLGVYEIFEWSNESFGVVLRSVGGVEVRFQCVFHMFSYIFVYLKTSSHTDRNSDLCVLSYSQELLIVHLKTIVIHLL